LSGGSPRTLDRDVFVASCRLCALAVVQSVLSNYLFRVSSEGEEFQLMIHSRYDECSDCVTASSPLWRDLQVAIVDGAKSMASPN